MDRVELKSKAVLYCQVRIWALIIGWVQMIISTPYVLVITVAVIMRICGSEIPSLPFNNGDTNNQKGEMAASTFSMFGVSHTVLLSAVFLASSALSFIAGIILIVGVKQRQLVHLKTWMAIQVLLVALVIIELASSAINAGSFFSESGGFEFVKKALYLLVSTCWIGLVDIHRKELQEYADASDALPANIQE